MPEPSECIGSEDAERIVNEWDNMPMGEETMDWNEDDFERSLVAYAYKCGRMDERNKGGD